MNRYQGFSTARKGLCPTPSTLSTFKDLRPSSQLQQTPFCLPLPSPRVQVRGLQPRSFHQGVGTVPKLSQQTSQEFSTFDLRDPTKAFRIKPRAVGWLPLPPPGRSAVCPETVDTGSNSSPFLLGAESPACSDAKREAATKDLQRSCCVHLEAWGVT